MYCELEQVLNSFSKTEYGILVYYVLGGSIIVSAEMTAHKEI